LLRGGDHFAVIPQDSFGRRGESLPDVFAVVEVEDHRTEVVQLVRQHDRAGLPRFGGDVLQMLRLPLLPGSFAAVVVVLTFGQDWRGNKGGTIPSCRAR